MRVTTKGQVTIPQAVRKKLGIKPHSEVAFVEEENGRFYLKKVRPRRGELSRFRRAHEAGDLLMSTDEILKLTRY